MLAHPRILIAMTILVVILTYGFSYFNRLVGDTYLDTLASSDKVQKTIRLMSPAQRRAHFWITATLDTIYPIAYGGLLIGFAMCMAGRYKRWAIIATFITIVADFLENVVQMLALKGNTTVIAAKALLTPVKYISLLFAVVLLGIFMVRHWWRRPD